jgi:predicted metallo-beta-lactamase superfamily hydrolase
VVVTFKVEMIGSESLGVRGLSCFLEHRGIKVLIDPGVALGFTRWGFHPHPIQAVAGDKVRNRIKEIWRSVDYVVLSHMHGDHVPLYNANPFQLDLHHLDYNDKLRIIAPDPSRLKGRGRIRLEKIIEVYCDSVITFKYGGFGVGPINIYGPFSHGISSNTLTFASLIDIGEKVIHLSDTELLCDKLIDLTVKLKPDIIITDGPPVYRFLHNPTRIEALLRKASTNVARLTKVAHTIIIDHHINRCDEGYQWITTISRKHRDVKIVTAAEYMKKTPLFLESWRRTLYKYYPVNNLWFNDEYSVKLEEYRPIYHRIADVMNDHKTPSEKTLVEVLENMSQ